MANTKVHGEYLDPSVISAQTEVTAVGSDHMLIFDATDNALKKALLSDLIETVGSTPTFTSAVISGDLTVDTSTLKVDSSNNRVGIGVTSPTGKLGIYGGNIDDIPLVITHAWGSSSTALISASNASSEVFKVERSGNVGIGGSPDTQLNIKNGDDAVVRIESIGSESGDDARLELKTTNGTFTIQNDRSLGTSGALTFAGNTSDNLVIDHNLGLIGIGTASPETYLHIKTTSPTISMTDTNSFSDTNDRFQIRANADVGQFQWYDDSASSTTTLMTLTPSGYVEIASASQVRLTLGNSGTAGTNTANWVRGTGNELGFNSAGGGFHWEIGGTERMRILASGGLTFNGDTAAANALDDYEEGTWTPGFGGATLSTATGHYTKIGNQVTVHYHIVSSGGMPTSSAQVQISGLPFTIDSNGAGAIYARYYTPNDSTLTTILVDGDSFIRLININEQNFDYTVYGELEASHNNSVDIRGTATYKV